MSSALLGGGADIPWYLSSGIQDINCIAAYQAKNIGSQAGSYINQRNPGTFDLTVGAAPGWTTAAGWSFDGVNDYLRTGVVPVKQLWTMIVWFTGLTQGANKYIASTRNGVPSWGVAATSGPGYIYFSGNSLSIIRTATAGYIALAGNVGYWNGALEAGSITDTGTDMGVRDIFLGCRNADGTAGNFAAITIERVAIYNITLSLAQIQAVGASVIPFILGAGNPAPLSAYAQSVLALTPLAYWPMNETTGGSVLDYTGNDRGGVVGTSVNKNIDGKYGKCYQFQGVNGSKIAPSANLTAAMNMNEYSIATWINVNVRPDILAVRVFNTYNVAVSEYSALEIRIGDEMGLFFKEGGVEQNISHMDLPTAEDEVWAHIVLFNSVSGDVMGIYYNGTLYEFTRTLAGTAGPVGATYPECFNWLDGYAQHVAFFDHKLTQGEVDTICT